MVRVSSRSSMTDWVEPDTGGKRVTELLWPIVSGILTLNWAWVTVRGLSPIYILRVTKAPLAWVTTCAAWRSSNDWTTQMHLFESGNVLSILTQRQ